MKRRIPTILIILAILLTGAAYLYDFVFFTDPATGFATVGTVWLRYVLLLVPFLLAFVGSFSLGASSIGALRVRNPLLGVLFCAAAITGAAFGALGIYSFLSDFSAYKLIMGILYLWYAVWMLLTAVQMFTQRYPSPTKSALWGMLAALPFCVQTIYRVFVKPASLYRVAPQIRIFAALLTMLCFGILLRALYIAMLRSRARWMYSFGLFTFLLTLLEFLQGIYDYSKNVYSLYEVAEAGNMFVFGLVMAGISLSIARQKPAAVAPSSFWLEDFVPPPQADTGEDTSAQDAENLHESDSPLAPPSMPPQPPMVAAETAEKEATHPAPMDAPYNTPAPPAQTTSNGAKETFVAELLSHPPAPNNAGAETILPLSGNVSSSGQTKEAEIPRGSAPPARSILEYFSSTSKKDLVIAPPVSSSDTPPPHTSPDGQVPSP